MSDMLPTSISGKIREPAGNAYQATDAAIVFFHVGSLPKYLLCAMESARFFNPDKRMFLLTDGTADLPRLGVEIASISDYVHPQLQIFRKHYKHISAADANYERICFERWFYLDQLLMKKGNPRAVYLDSDCLLSSNLDRLLEHMPDRQLSASREGGPACTFSSGRMQEFLAFMIEKFIDAGFLQEQEHQLTESLKRGGMRNFTDMTLVEMFTTGHAEGHVYRNDLPIGHIDHNINVPDGKKSYSIPHRKRLRKKIVWRAETDCLRPYFIDAETGIRQPALAIHYQSGAKRLIRRFNTFGRKHSKLTMRLRSVFFTWMHGGPGSQFI